MKAISPSGCLSRLLSARAPGSHRLPLSDMVLRRQRATTSHQLCNAFPSTLLHSPAWSPFPPALPFAEQHRLPCGNTGGDVACLFSEVTRHNATNGVGTQTPEDWTHLGAPVHKVKALPRAPAWPGQGTHHGLWQEATVETSGYTSPAYGRQGQWLWYCPHQKKAKPFLE